MFPYNKAMVVKLEKKHLKSSFYAFCSILAIILCEEKTEV